MVHQSAKHPFTHSPDDYCRLIERTLMKPDETGVSYPDLMKRIARVWEEERLQFIYDRVYLFGGFADDYRPRPIDRQSDLVLTPSKAKLLFDALIRLRDAADSLTPGQRHRSDQAISMLIKVLPIEMAWQVVAPWMDTDRNFRRSTLKRVLSTYGIPDEHAATVVGWFREQWAGSTLNLISRHPNACRELTHDDLLDVLEQPVDPVLCETDTTYLRSMLYWKMRMFSAYLEGHGEIDVNIAMSYPLEFVWAVGFGLHVGCLPALRTVMEWYADQPELVWRAYRAMQRVGSADDVARARELAARLAPPPPPDW